VAGTIEIVAGDTRAKVALRGAELRSWRVDGRELMWQGDAASWPATSPVLFPVCGATRDGVVRVAGQNFPLGLHGFAAQAMFAIAEIDSDHVRFALRDDLGTRTRYPFGFALTLDYRVAPGRLTARLGVRNSGSGRMPYSCGLHPGFSWPFAGGEPTDYRILFDEQEEALVPVIAAGGLFSRHLRGVPLSGRVLNLAPSLFAAEALCFLGAASRGLRFEGPKGAIRVATKNFPHFVLWTKPPAEFLCIETCSGYGDLEDFVGDLFAKPSMRILVPGEEAVHEARFSFTL
jgi:galactose mutarotase-like enzyme